MTNIVLKSSSIFTGSSRNLLNGYIKIENNKITYVGNTSMEIKVESFVEHIDGSRDLVNRAYLTMVALDDNGMPAKVPELILDSEQEIIENENAKARKQIRKRNT